MVDKVRLSPKQEAFCLEYVKLGANGTRAVLAAGYDCDEFTAKVIASENLTKPNIVARLNDLRSQIALKTTIMPFVARQEHLTDIAKAQKDERPGVSIQAVAELNKMDHVYEVGTRLQVNNVRFVIGKGYQQEETNAIQRQGSAETEAKGVNAKTAPCEPCEP